MTACVGQIAEMVNTQVRAICLFKSQKYSCMLGQSIWYQLAGIDMFRKIFLLFWCQTAAYAQPAYTKLRAGISVEGAGIAPTAMVSAEIPFLYKYRSFCNFQTGLGFVGNKFSKSPSFTNALSYNFLLNRYRRSLCSPAPDYNRVEYYSEAGFALSIFNYVYGGLPVRLDKNTNYTPMGFLGLRMHFVQRKWLYIVKLRLTPVLDRPFAFWGGAAFGLGWR